LKEGTITPQPTRAGWIYYKLNPPLKKGEKEMKTEAAQPNIVAVKDLPDCVKALKVDNTIYVREGGSYNEAAIDLLAAE
jgi:hypothetical protein